MGEIVDLAARRAPIEGMAEGQEAGMALFLAASDSPNPLASSLFILSVFARFCAMVGVPADDLAALARQEVDVETLCRRHAPELWAAQVNAWRAEEDARADEPPGAA